MDIVEEVPVAEKNESEEHETTYLLNSDASNLDKLEEGNTYQSFIRWLAREEIWPKFLMYIFSERIHHALHASFYDKVKAHFYFFLRTASLPQDSEAVLRRIRFAEILSETMGIITEKIWTFIFSGLLLHDSIIYFSQPLDRYGNTFPDILGGISPNQLTWSSQLGGERPDSFSFWIPLSLPLLLLPSLMIYKFSRRGGSHSPESFSDTQQRNFSDTNPNTILSQSIPDDSLVEEKNVVSRHSAEEYWVGSKENIDNRNTLAINSQEGPHKSLNASINYEESLFLLLWDKTLTEEERFEKLSHIKNIEGWLDTFYLFQALAKVTDSFDLKSLQLAGIEQQGKLINFRKIREEALKFIESQIQFENQDAKLKYFPYKIYCQYLLWSLGRSQNVLAHVMFLPLVIYTIYAKVRFLEMFIQKIVEIVQFFKQKMACEAQNKTWIYMPDFGNYKCTVCGDNPLVYYGNVFTSQGCFDSLFSEKRSPEEVLKYLGPLLKHPNFTQLDLSQQNWTQWSLPQWSIFLNNISHVTQHLNNFNLSSPLFNPLFPNDGHITALKEFLALVSVEMLDFHKQGLGDRLFSELVESVKNNTLTYLDISSNQLTDESAARIGRFIATSQTLKTLKAAHNPFSDAGIEHISSALANSSLTEVDISDTYFGAEGAASIATVIADPQNKIESLDISQNDLSSADAVQLGQAVANSTSLENLNLSQTNIDDVQVDAFMTSAIQTKTSKSFDFSDNPLTDQGMFLIINHAQNHTVTALYFNHNYLTDEGMERIAEVLRETSLQKLGVANAKSFTVNSMSKVFSHLPETLVYLDISGNDLGDDLAETFVDVFNNGTPCHLKSVCLGGNRLTDDGGEKLIRLFAVHNVTDLSLDHNLLTDKTLQALSEVYPNNNFVSLDLSHNQIGNDTGVVSLAPKLSTSDLEKLSLSHNQLTEKSALAIAENLVTPTPHIGEVGDPIVSVDEIRALRKTSPKTHLTEIDLSHNQIHIEGARGLCRVLSNTEISIDNLELEENPVGDFDIHACQSSAASRLRPFSFFSSSSEVFLPESTYSVESSIQNFNSFPALSEGNPGQNQNTSASAYLGVTLVPGIGTVIIGLIALYLLYRAFYPALNSVWESSSSFFGQRSHLNVQEREIEERKVKEEEIDHRRENNF